MNNQSSESAELSFDEKHTWLTKNEAGLYWDWKLQGWVTQEAMLREFAYMAEYRQRMGSNTDVAALNAYENQIGF